MEPAMGFILSAKITIYSMRELRCSSFGFSTRLRRLQFMYIAMFIIFWTILITVIVYKVAEFRAEERAKSYMGKVVVRMFQIFAVKMNDLDLDEDDEPSSDMLQGIALEAFNEAFDEFATSEITNKKGN
jgi:hypothetical protein